jgi:hypothetical protein
MSALHLPTFVSAAWTVTGLRDSVTSSLASNKWGNKLSLFFYAVTEQGWREIRNSVQTWKSSGPNRHIVAYVGTDHGITEPEALQLMHKDGVSVRLLSNYQGIFHPKVLWLAGNAKNSLWVGSNNLTRDALLHNIEFAVQIDCPSAPPELIEWSAHVHAASVPFDEALLKSYGDERRSFATSRAAAGTFTWTKKKEPAAVAAPGVEKGDLVIEVMPLETGIDGKQIQLPKAAAVGFFGLADHAGASRRLSLTQKATSETRTLTMTIFENYSVRLSINELDYRDRPCVMIFHALSGNKFEFEIVQRSLFPTRYGALLKLCSRRTREGSRRWTIL